MSALTFLLLTVIVSLKFFSPSTLLTGLQEVIAVAGYEGLPEWRWKAALLSEHPLGAPAVAGRQIIQRRMRERLR